MGKEAGRELTQGTTDTVGVLGTPEREVNGRWIPKNDRAARKITGRVNARNIMPSLYQNIINGKSKLKPASSKRGRF